MFEGSHLFYGLLFCELFYLNLSLFAYCLYPDSSVLYIFLSVNYE
jgi:hypothetical protein